VITSERELNVYYYHIKITPDLTQDSTLSSIILRKSKSIFEKMMGIYVISGANVYTTEPLVESIAFLVMHGGTQYTVLVEKETEKFIKGGDSKSLKMEDHCLYHTLINILIKEAFRQTSLR
jgi:hypothetical protein